jgi:4-carboxymuconolactone decarboxylase
MRRCHDPAGEDVTRVNMAVDARTPQREPTAFDEKINYGRSRSRQGTEQGMTDDVHTAETKQDRFERGMNVLAAIDGEVGRKVIDSLADISPELGHQVVAWAFGDIYNRPGLAPRDRQLVTLGILTALGGCEPQLEVHINAALNVGLSPEEVIEALLHSAVYCGMPRAINATLAAKRVFAERDLPPIVTQ